MNIENIETVSDLLKQNKEKTPFETAADALCECNYSESRKVVKWLLTNMIDFHKQCVHDIAKGEQEGNILVWASDAGKLELILDAFQEIE
jgi:hypothetical protein